MQFVVALPFRVCAVKLHSLSNTRIPPQHCASTYRQLPRPEFYSVFFFSQSSVCCSDGAKQNLKDECLYSVMERQRAQGGANAGKTASQTQRQESRGASDKEISCFSSVDDSELCKSNNNCHLQ